MKEQLTIKELAAYLPHKVMCLNQHLSDIEFVQEELIGISNHITWSGVFNARHGSNHVPVSALKPILYPLSSLTKEIKHKGEKFVPLLRICEYLGLKYTKFTVLDNSVDLVLDTKYHRANTKTKEPQKVRFWFNYYKAISFNCSNMKLLMYKDIYGAVQKLAEWHMDFQNLIPQGKAIDKTTIQ